MRIEKKTWPELFQKILNGEKTFEVRLADFECKPEDVLVLREYNPSKKKYTGRVIEKKVGFMFNTKDLKYWSKEDINKFGLYVITLKD